MHNTNTLLFPLPYTPTDCDLTNNALTLFFDYMVLYYNDDTYGRRIKSEEQMCEYIMDLVINEIELMYQETPGYMYTGDPQPVTPLENTVYVNDAYFNQLVRYLSKHIYTTILPEVHRIVDDFRRNKIRVISTDLAWTKDNPTLLTVLIKHR